MFEIHIFFTNFAVPNSRGYWLNLLIIKDLESLEIYLK